MERESWNLAGFQVPSDLLILDIGPRSVDGQIVSGVWEGVELQGVLAQKIKGMIKSLSADCNYYSDRYCKRKSAELQRLLVEVSDACTGGDFESTRKKADPGRYILIVNAINRVKSELHRRKL